MLLDGIILDSINKIKQNRTISGIYLLLIGKKSIQSVYDAKLFQLDRYYGIVPTLARDEFNKLVVELEKREYIQSDVKKDGIYTLTGVGKQKLQEWKRHSIHSYFRGLQYSGKDMDFLKRLYLMVQTFSNLRQGNRSFIPVVDTPEITHWVRNFYQKNHDVSVSEGMYQELYNLLQHLSSVEAEIFVDRLSGYNHYGMSMEQIAAKYQLTLYDAKLYLTAITHHIIHDIMCHLEDFRLLYPFIRDSKQNKFITSTANQTYQLLVQGHAIEAIASIRGLKKNTIQDHIVEIALHDTEFPIHDYVSLPEQEEILQAIRKCHTYKLKEIKEHCQDGIHYFQIRLVLARLQDYLLEDEIDDKESLT